MSATDDWKRIRDYHKAFFWEMGGKPAGIWCKLEWGPSISNKPGEFVMVGDLTGIDTGNFQDRADKIIQILRTYPTVTVPSIRLLWKKLAPAAPTKPAPGPYDPPVVTPPTLPSTPPSDDDYEIMA